MQTILYKTQNLDNIQSLMAKAGKYSIDDLNRLVERIVLAKKLDEKQIAVSVGRNEGYISQCRSRKEVSDKFIETLQMKYKTELEGLQNVSPPKYDLHLPGLPEGITSREYIDFLKAHIDLLKEKAEKNYKEPNYDEVITILKGLQQEVRVIQNKLDPAPAPAPAAKKQNPKETFVYPRKDRKGKE